MITGIWTLMYDYQPACPNKGGYRVPTGHGKPGKPGKLQFYFPGLENSLNLRKMPELMEKIFVNKKNISMPIFIESV